MSEKKTNEQDQRVGNNDDATLMNTTNNVDVEQHEGTSTAPENGTEATSESPDPGSTNNVDVDQSKGTQPPPKEGSDSTSTLQESSTPNPAEQHPDLSTEINQTLSELLDEQTELLVEKLNSGNQTLDEIKEDIENFKENNLLEAKSVIHHLIQFYDSFARLESQFAPISGTFESLGIQSGAITDSLKSIKDWVDGRLSEEEKKKRRQKKEFVSALKELKGMLANSPSVSQEDTEMEDGSVVHQEESKDLAPSLSQANAEMTDELIRFRNNLENALYEFKDVLARIDDVTPYKTVPDETNDLRFDRKKHMAVDSKRTDDEAQHLQVAESHKAGFYRGEKQVVFRPEEVTVYRYEEPTDEPTEPDGEAPAAEDVTADTDAEGTTQESPTTAGDVSANEKGEKENE